jgi:hypothetical protein
MEGEHTRGIKLAIITGLLALCSLSSSFATDRSAIVGSDVSVTSVGSFSTVLGKTCAANKVYEVEAFFRYQNSNTSAITWEVNYSTTGWFGQFMAFSQNGTATLVSGTTSLGVNFPPNTGQVANTNQFVWIKGTLVTGSNTGDFRVRATRGGAGTLSVYQGGYIVTRQIYPALDADDVSDDDTFTSESVTQPPSQKATLGLLFNSGLRPCPNAHCSPTPTPTVAPTATPTATPTASPSATPDLSDGIKQSNQFLVAVLGFSVVAIALWRFKA